MPSTVQLQILINAVDNASPVLGRIAGSAQDKLGKAVRRGAMVGSAAMAGFAVASVKMAGDFDAAMTQSLAIMGDVSDAMRKDMADAAREMALVTTFSAKEAADAYYFLASAGMDAQQSMEALPVVAQFAQAGMFDLAKATDLLTDAQSALGLASEDTAENMKNMTYVGDILVKMAQKANASVEQFAISLTQKGASALKGASKSLEEGAGMLAYWADQGLKAEAAGNALAGTLQMLPKIAMTNADAFAAYGVEIFDANDKMKSFADIAKEFAPILEEMTDAQRAQAFEQMGINRLLADTILKMKGGSEAIREYTEDAYDAASATKEVAEKQLQTFNAQLSLLKSALEDVQIEIGNELLPKLTKLVTTIREGIIPAFKEWWQVHLPEITTGVEAFGETLGLMADTFISFGRWILDNQVRLVLAIGAIGLAFAWTNPLLLVLAGAGGLIFAIGLFRQEIQALPLPLLKLREQITEVVLDLLEMIHTVQLLSPLLALLGPKGAAAALALIVTYDEVGEAIDRLKEDLSDTRSQMGFLESGMADFDASPMVNELMRVIYMAHETGESVAALQRMAFGAPQFGIAGPIPAPTALEATFMRDMGEAAKTALQQGLDTPPPPTIPSPTGPGGGDAATEMEEIGRDLGQRLSATFTEELVAGLEGVPPKVLAVISKAGEALETFSASFRPAIQEVFVGIQELVTLGPQVPESYRAARDALDDFGTVVDYVAAVLAGQKRELAGLAYEVWEAQFVYDDLTASLQRYEDQLGAAQDALRRFAGAQLEGTAAFEQRAWEIEQAIAGVRLQIIELRQAGGAEEAIQGLQDQLGRLRDEAEKVRLEEQLQLDPLRRQIEDLLDPTKELTFEEIIRGISDAQGTIEDIQPVIDYLNELLATQKEKVEDAEAAYDAQQETVKTTEDLLNQLAKAYETLEGTLVSETKVVLDQYLKIAYGTIAVRGHLIDLEVQIEQNLQPALNSISTDHAVGQMHNLEDAARNAAAAVANVSAAEWGSTIAGYGAGGIVPGPLGAPQLAVVHGGERITPGGGSQESGGGATIIHRENFGRQTFVFPQVDPRAAMKEMDRQFRKM